MLLIVCSAFYLTTSAQEFKVDVPRIMKHSEVLKQLNPPKKSINSDSLVKEFQDFFIMKHNPGMYHLPQDNMPCLVPDTDNIAAMPNAWDEQPATSTKPTIPNPGLRARPFTEKPKVKAK